LSQYENVRGVNRYSAGWCGSECHSVQLGGGAIVKAPINLCAQLARFSYLQSAVPAVAVITDDLYPILRIFCAIRLGRKYDYSKGPPLYQFLAEPGTSFFCLRAQSGTLSRLHSFWALIFALLPLRFRAPDFKLALSCTCVYIFLPIVERGNGSYGSTSLFLYIRQLL
jgi:hypothetical protein